MKISKRVYFIPLLILVSAIAGSYFALIRDNHRRTGITKDVPAEVIKTEVRRIADPETGQERSVDTIVTFLYDIDGRKYERVVRKSKTESLAFVPWGKAKVCYDPANRNTIEEGELFPVTYECGK